MRLVNRGLFVSMNKDNWVPGGDKEMDFSVPWALLGRVVTEVPWEVFRAKERRAGLQGRSGSDRPRARLGQGPRSRAGLVLLSAQ